MRSTPSLLALLMLLGVLCGGRAAAQTPAASFPDVPPWHWAYPAVASDQQAALLVGYPASPEELAGNALIQVYDSFAHAGADGAQTWAERFTYDRPPAWPAPLVRSRLVAYSLIGLRVVVTGETASAGFTARLRVRGSGAGIMTSMAPTRVTLRLIDGDWKVDYAALARTSPVFR